MVRRHERIPQMNTFKSAQIVKFNALPAEYSAEAHTRGSAFYTVRSHTISELRRNARRWMLGYESPESTAKEYGEVLDCLALTPTQWPKRYAITPPSYKNKKGEQSKWRNDLRIEEVAAWHAEHDGLTIVSAETNGQVHAAIKRLRENEAIASFLDSGQSQCWIAAIYEDRATGLKIPVKCLIDKVPNSEHPVYGTALGDLKSTRNAEPRQFTRDAWRYGYHIAAAWYQDLYEAATGEERTDFFHVLQESYPPYECRMPVMSARFVNVGRLIYQDTLARYCRCLASGNWPGYVVDEARDVTDCEDWMTDPANVFSEMIEEEPEPEPATDLIP